MLIVGSGGGRDILSALLFDQKSVIAVEINDATVEMMKERFSEFTGYLDRDPRVSFFNDEARSYIARQKNQFDILQMSLIDTRAATSAGAFVLSEHSLYTVEAWELFLRRLNPKGILTVSRWYFGGRPGEMYRLTALAGTALMRRGIRNPQNHIAIARVKLHPEPGNVPLGIATILVSQDPFSARDVATLEQVAKKMKCDIVLSPNFAWDSTFKILSSGKDLDAFTSKFPIRIDPPTDDSPFFLFMARLLDFFRPGQWKKEATFFNMKPVFILGGLLVTVVGLTLLCIILPLVLTTKSQVPKTTAPLFIYFFGIGFGFMRIEISQMQRLIVFLGHPVYGLSVVLFSLLLSSGLGSYWSQRIRDERWASQAVGCLFLLLCALAAFGVLTPHTIGRFAGSVTAVRIAVATGILFPIGVFMGTAFPLGMRAAAARSPSLTPWLWGINGATSVCASVVAVIISLGAGISASFWAGWVCYLLAFLAAIWMGRWMTRGSMMEMEGA